MELDMSKRTDLHKPSAIVPSHYTFVAFDYYGTSERLDDYMQDERAAFEAHQKDTGGTVYKSDTQRGTCDCCGASAQYVAKFYYAPANEYVTLGHICAAKMGIGDDTAFKSFHKNIRAQLEFATGKKKAHKTLIDAGMTDVIDLYDATRATLVGWDSEKQGDWWNHLTWEQQVTDEMMGKLVKYGRLSEKQMALLAKLPTQHAEKAAKKAAWAAERAAKLAKAQPLPSVATRVTLQGKVLTVKGQDGPYGFVWKMLVEHADGWKVWGTVPGNIMEDVLRNSSAYGDALAKEVREKLVGKFVEFDAKIEASEDDSKFGFFSRPTKASVLAEAVAA
jgi:hypothetical protein